MSPDQNRFKQSLAAAEVIVDRCDIDLRFFGDFFIFRLRKTVFREERESGLQNPFLGFVTIRSGLSNRVLWRRVYLRNFRVFYSLWNRLYFNLNLNLICIAFLHLPRRGFSMKKRLIAIGAVILVAAAAAGGYAWYRGHQVTAPTELTLYGNVDIRQVSLAFDASGRISEMNVDEGQVVEPGQVLAKLDTRTLELQAKQAAAQIGVQEQTLLKLKRGNRPQEIAEARSQMLAYEAQLTKAKQDLERANNLWNAPGGHAISTQNYDAAKSAERVASQNLVNAQKAYELMKIGPRVEDIRSAESSLAAAKANLELLNHEISLGTLKSPDAAIVRSRLLQPGDMAAAAKPVYTLALTSPKWVRVYVNEKDLGNVKPGMTASVVTDTHPNTPIEGMVGYISSVSEFTPKTVETPDLRSSLVYEVRVIVKDPKGDLRLGQPATVKINLNSKGAEIPASTAAAVSQVPDTPPSAAPAAN